MTEKVVLSPADKARHAFDAENNVEPCRTIAERIVYNCPHPDDMVDDLSHAIEDARALGKKRGAAEIERLQAELDGLRSLLDNETYIRAKADYARGRLSHCNYLEATEREVLGAALKDTTP